MRGINHICLSAILVLFAGCAHHTDRGPKGDWGLSTTQSGVIVVHVGGSVNTPGKLELSYPFSVEHAIQQAGGLAGFEQELNRKVVVIHKDGKQTVVLRKHYASFLLADGDAAYVPRR